jgi:hypothetical protein
MSVFPHAIALNQYLEQMFLSKLIKCIKLCRMKLIIHWVKGSKYPHVLVAMKTKNPPPLQFFKNNKNWGNT